MLRSTTIRLVLAAVVASAAQLGTVAVARAAGASPFCAAKCIPIYEKHMTALLGCAVKALKRDGGVDPNCPAKLASKMKTLWHKPQKACSDNSCYDAYPFASLGCYDRVAPDFPTTSEREIFGTLATPSDAVTRDTVHALATIFGGCTFSE